MGAKEVSDSEDCVLKCVRGVESVGPDAVDQKSSAATGLA